MKNLKFLAALLLLLPFSQMAKADLCVDSNGQYITCAASATGSLASPGAIGASTPSTVSATNYNMSGTLTSPSTFGTTTNSWVTCCVNLSGTQTFVSPYAPLNWSWNYSLNAISAALGDYGESHVVHLRNGFAGIFTLFNNSLLIDEAPLAPATDTSTHGYYLNGNFIDVTPNVGGFALNPTDSRGRPETFFCSLSLEAGATNIAQATACEIDNNLKAGASSLTNVGVLGILGSATLNRGALDDAEFLLAGTVAGGGTAAWKTGISFGGLIATQPFISDSTYIKSFRRQSPVLDSAPLADAGVDYESTTFTNYFLRSQGFGVGPLGNTNANNLTLTGGSLTVSSAGIASIAAVADNKGITGGLYYGSASLPTIVIQPSPGGGTQAAATVATVTLGEADILTAGTGVVDGDTLTMAGPTGTQPTLTAHVGTFTGSISKNVLTVGTVTGAAIAVGQLLTDGSVNITTPVYITSGSGTSWKLNTGFSSDIASESMKVTGVTIASAGSLTAVTASPTTTGGSASVQPTFNFGFSLATFTVGTAGTLYSVLPPPVLWPSVASNSRNVPAILAATMSAASQGALTINSTSVKIPGSSSGTITTQAQAAAGTYNWNWPTTAGVAGQVLTSQAGSSTAMTWTTPPLLCQSGTAVTHTGDQTATNLYTCTVPANTLGANGMLRITVLWQYTNNADTKTLAVYFSTTSGAATGLTVLTPLAVTTTAQSQHQFYVRNAGATGSQIMVGTGLGSPFGTFSGSTSGSIDTTAASYVNVRCTDTSSSSDTCGILGVTVEVYPAT